MTTKSLGINLINMYEKMVREDFDPLITMLKARFAGFKDKILAEVKRDFGVYELYEEQAAVELRLKEIKESLQKYEKAQYQPLGGGWISLIDEEVKKRMKLLNAPLTEVEANRESVLRTIRLAGVGQEIKSTFEAMPSIITDLTEKFANLPAITDEDIKALKDPDVTDADIIDSN